MRLFLAPLFVLIACDDPNNVVEYLEYSGHSDISTKTLPDGRTSFESTKDHMVCEGTASFEVTPNGSSKAFNASCQALDACTADDPNACWELARALSRAHETLARVRAHAIGCEAGSARHCGMLVTITEDQPSLGDATQWATKGCALDDSWSCHALAHRVAEAESQAIHEKACELGSTLACTDLVELHAKAGDIPGARKLAYNACKLGSGRGCHQLSIALRLEPALADAAELSAYYRGRACALGYQQSCKYFLEDQEG